MRQQASAILETFLSSQTARDLADVEVLGREVPFAYAEGGAVMRGSIDLLYRKGTEVVIADYKTEHVEDSELAARREKYERQGRTYCAAVEKALGLKNVTFKLLFLRRPDV